MKIQFIWCGKMWEVILQNLLQVEKKENIWVETKTDVSKNNLAKKYWINIWVNLNENILRAPTGGAPTDIIFLLIKPQQFKELYFEKFWENKIIFSFMAGINVKKISEKLKTKKIIRAMPNTPMLVWKWVIWYFVNNNKDIINRHLYNNYENYFRKIFSKNSSLIKCETEDKIDKITALSGSGPAYYYFITEILKQKAIEFWFSKKESENIANNTFIWASKLLEKSQEKVEILRKNITSKWWTTQKALETFEKNWFWEKFKEGIDEAYKRAKNLT